MNLILVLESSVTWHCCRPLYSCLDSNSESDHHCRHSPESSPARRSCLAAGSSDLSIGVTAAAFAAGPGTARGLGLSSSKSVCRIRSLGAGVSRATWSGLGSAMAEPQQELSGTPGGFMMHCASVITAHNGRLWCLRSDSSVPQTSSAASSSALTAEAVYPVASLHRGRNSLYT